MTSDTAASLKAASVRIRTIVEAEPSAVIRILQLFQNRNLVPGRIATQHLGSEYIQLEIEISDLSNQILEQIVAKIRGIPTVIAAALCD